jgi:hypothetical protein
MWQFISEAVDQHPDTEVEIEQCFVDEGDSIAGINVETKGRVA